MHLGLKIKIARISKGFTQQQLADKISKTRPLISHIEQTGDVNQLTYAEICKALNINDEDIKNIVNEPQAEYKRGKGSKLTEDNEKLKEEIALLKELISSQKEVIQSLKEKLSGKAKKG